MLAIAAGSCHCHCGPDPARCVKAGESRGSNTGAKGRLRSRPAKALRCGGQHSGPEGRMDSSSPPAGGSGHTHAQHHGMLGSGGVPRSGPERWRSRRSHAVRPAQARSTSGAGSRGSPATICTTLHGGGTGGDGRAPFPWLGRWRNLIGGFRQSLPANGRQQPVVHGGSRPLHDWLLAAARAWPSAGECFLEKNATGRRGWTEHAVPPRYPSTSPRKPLTRSTALAVPPST